MVRGKGLATLANELRQSGLHYRCMRFVWLFALCERLCNTIILYTS